MNKGTTAVYSKLDQGGEYWKSNKNKEYAGWAAFVESKLGRETKLDKEVDDGKPDLGAYESDPDVYWIPGRQLQHSAATPIPFHGADGVSAEVDLMWLPSLDCIKSKCSQKVTFDGKVVATVTAPKNIAKLPTQSAGSAHSWKVESGGSSSPTWSFTVAKSQKDVCGRITGLGHGEGDADEYDKEEGGGGKKGGSNGGDSSSGGKKGGKKG